MRHRNEDCLSKARLLSLRSVALIVSFKLF
jgi:hypothetical protein